MAARGLKEFGTHRSRARSPISCCSTADPLADISNLRKVAAVMKDGRTVDRARLPQLARAVRRAAAAAPGTKDF